MAPSVYTIYNAFAFGDSIVSSEMFLKVNHTLIYSKPSFAFSKVVFASATATLSIVIESPFASAASPIPYTFASSFFELSDVVLPPVGVELSDGDSPSQAAREIIIISVRKNVINFFIVFLHYSDIILMDYQPLILADTPVSCQNF